MSRNLGVPVTTAGEYYFLSYNSEDEARVAEFAKELHSRAFPLWYDNGIRVGENWKKELAERIKNCKAVVMFLSKGVLGASGGFPRDEGINKLSEQLGVWRSDCCSVPQSHPTLCNPRNCSTPVFPVFHYLPKFA